MAGNNGACCVAQGEDCTACGVGCGGGGNGALAYVGHGQGGYIQETTYKYVGCGGDFARPRRDFTSYLPDYDVLPFELVAPDPTSSVAVVRDTDVAAIRLRSWLRTVGDHLVSSPAGVLLLDDGKGLPHSSP